MAIDTPHGGGAIPGDAGPVFDVGYSKVRLIVDTRQGSGSLAVTEQSLVPKALAGPLHTHANEDGWIYVVRGVIGARLGTETVRMEEGGTVYVPRRLSHTFWNATDSETVVLEMFSPAGLERWFAEIADALSASEPDLERILSAGRRYGTELDLASVPVLLEEHGLVLPGL